MDTQNVVCSRSGISLGLKKEGDVGMHYNGLSPEDFTLRETSSHNRTNSA